MNIGLKNRLRLISLFPILILFSIASFYVYNSFLSYQGANELKHRLNENKKVNNLVTNLSRERGMTVMYLGNSSPTTHKSLTAQRDIVTSTLNKYIAHVKSDEELHDHSKGVSSCGACNDVKNAKKLIADLKEFRPKVDKQEVEFDEVFYDMYGAYQNKMIQHLERLTDYGFDEEISTLASVYLNFVQAKEYTAAERDYISYALARSTKLDSEELNVWLTLLGKADAISYDAINDTLVKSKLNALFKNEDNQELIEDITIERADILQAIKDGLYATQSGIWFTMLSEKVNVIDDAEKIVLNAMDARAIKVQAQAIQILTVSFSVWIVSLLIGILGFLLSNDIAKNIKNLELVLVRVAEDTADDDSTLDRKINLDTAKGTSQAYKLLESIIDQTREDKLAAQDASEAKSMFLANMSHEIRTPLNGIVGFTELLKDTNLEDEQREFIDIIEKSSENLLEIINNILDLSKIESNKLEIEDIAFNPIDEFESAVEVYAVRASEKHIDLGCFIDPSLERPIKGDPTKIKEVVINLLSNAVKFTNSGGSINVDIRRVETDQPNTAKVRFQVQDSGIGVTSEQKDKIFEAFSQADTSITRKYGGTGLGLTISSRFVELMGGQLDLESESGEGTTFFFELEFEEIESLNDLVKGTFSNYNALILESKSKKKTQDTYLKEYLDYFGVSYNIFHDESELQRLESSVNFDMIFVDYDYTSEDELAAYDKGQQQLVLITKSYYMKKIDSLKLDVLKTIYEPMNSSKVKLALESYDADAFAAKKSKAKIKKRKFDEKSSKFEANCLIAEDNIINQKLIKRTLEDLGLTVTLANNGLEAFEKRKNGNFDVVFMDIQMPVLDGVEATQEILDYEEDFESPHVPIIALTANALKGDRERFLAAGMDEYTTKPLVRSEIISLLNHFLSHKIIDTHARISDDNIAKEIKNVVEPVKQIHVPMANPKLETKIEDEFTLDDDFNLDDALAEAESELDLNDLEDELNTEPIVEENLGLDDDFSLEDIQVENKIEKKSKYDSDILLAKKSKIESKIFESLLTDLGYTYDIAQNNDELVALAREKAYKVVVFDKELLGLDIMSISSTINDKELDSSLVMMIDPSNKASAEDEKYVHEIIKNVVNKDLMRLVFEKFI